MIKELNINEKEYIEDEIRRNDLSKILNRFISINIYFYLKKYFNEFFNNYNQYKNLSDMINDYIDDFIIEINSDSIRKEIERI